MGSICWLPDQLMHELIPCLECDIPTNQPTLPCCYGSHELLLRYAGNLVILPSSYFFRTHSKHFSKIICLSRTVCWIRSSQYFQFCLFRLTMRRPITLFLASAAIYHSADAASTLAFGPSGLCPGPLTTVKIVPVYYSSYFPGETVIDIFGDGNTINVYGPTTIITAASVTEPPMAPSSPAFNIQLQGLNTKDKRAVSYIGFSGGPGDHGVAVGSQTEAAVFKIVASFLISDGDYVETELGAGFLKFEKTFTPPTDHSTWNANMTSVNLFNSAFTTGNGQALFCVASDESIYMELTSEPSFTCTQVTLNAVPGKCIFRCLRTPFTNCLLALSSAGSSTTTSIS